MTDTIKRLEQFLGIGSEDYIHENVCILAGQFSTGKSKFLNKLIGIDCLPVGTYETTDTPAYVSKGEDSAIFFADGVKSLHTLDEVKWLRKGDKSADLIRISCQSADIPEGITFVDMPGINSIDFKHELQFERILKSGAVVMYFLGKSISTVDVKYLNRIIESGAKTIIIRTKIDCIHLSEEGIDDVIRKERELYQKMFPDASTYFISLQGACVENEISLLKLYIHEDLWNDLQKYQFIKEKIYVRNVIKPGLLSMRSRILENQLQDNVTNKEKILKDMKHKGKRAKDFLIRHKGIIFDGLDTAKKNYIELGRKHIHEMETDKLNRAEIQQYIFCLFECLKRWYELELEDCVRQIDLIANSTMYEYDLLKPMDIDRVLDCTTFQRFSGDISCYFEEDDGTTLYFCSKQEAIRYFEHVLNRFFAEILMDFDNKYAGFVIETIKEYEKKNMHELEIMLPMIQKDFDGVLANIDGYLKETEIYD